MPVSLAIGRTASGSLAISPTTRTVRTVRTTAARSWRVRRRLGPIAVVATGLVGTSSTLSSPDITAGMIPENTAARKSPDHHREDGQCDQVIRQELRGPGKHHAARLPG